MEWTKYKNTHLWNDLPFEERKRLMPYMIEAQILHIEQTKAKVIKGHRMMLSDINVVLANLKRDLSELTATTSTQAPAADNPASNDNASPKEASCETSKEMPVSSKPI